MKRDVLIIIKGGGDMGSGVAARLHRAGVRLLITELPQPLTIRQSVAFATAVYQQRVTVEDITAQRVQTDDDVYAAWENHVIPVQVDPSAHAIARWQPQAVIDAIMAKRNTGTRLTDAPVVIALGPGFVAGQDCHAVVETQRGHYLGRVYYAGPAAPDTGVPGRVGDESASRVVRAPIAGVFHAARHIGEQVAAGDIIAYVNQTPVRAEIAGVVRGLLADGLAVSAGLKVGDIDPRGIVEYCHTISDKALAVGGGVLEALLRLSAF